MKIQILSDIHFEAHSDKGYAFFNKLNPKGIDVLVLAGDIATKLLIEPSIDKFCQMYPEVVYVPGNHESYGREWGWIKKELKKVSKKHSNLHVLQDSVAEIKSQRFVGCTMWYPETLAAHTYKESFSDFLAIEKGFDNIFKQNKKSDRFLWKNVQKGDIVVTHHMPTPKAIPERFKFSDINDFFVYNMENLIVEKEPAIWFFGHTHTSYDDKINNTRLVCNPFGYLWTRVESESRPQENLNFNYSKVVEI